MAASRDQRKTAGNRLSSLLKDETEEEFYKTAWGGFDEEAEDREYEEEVSGSDDVDSDFDNPENEVDDPVSDDADEEKRRKKKVVLLGQKKPKIKLSEKKPKILRRKVPDERKGDRRKSTRVAVVQNSRALKARLAEEERRRKSRRPRKRQMMRKITQEEMLEEAKITEMENLDSLNVYIQLEEEKKKMRTIKKPVITGPIIRFQSLTMVDVESNDETGKKLCSRNFLTFPDKSEFSGGYLFSKPRLSAPKKSYCIVTGLLARYKDPLTNYPYANAQAFRILRQHHSRGTLPVLVTGKDQLRNLTTAVKQHHQQISHVTTT
ncbi:vacuolar protein sorting-associated protein 72 homolog [Corticium candelabrum]|uniref:vacuolar protein sorting-associated protein 72 homolog n=1 Tax=Corticium candelabrum TaxID=121492 RepID=UPI002E25A8F7|nr:vacuolar protein sorting-associated protein 72 homolog [Corticium candelabrum]